MIIGLEKAIYEMSPENTVVLESKVLKKQTNGDMSKAHSSHLKDPIKPQQEQSEPPKYIA